MQGEDTYVFTVSNKEAEVIKQFVSAIDGITIGIDNDDIWGIMEAIANKRNSTNIAGVMIIYEGSEES